jgi:2-iminobutanoate/2-iminopropanoate deaminase
MHQPIMPDGMARPAARYAHATLVTNPARWLHLAGQVGIAADGTVPDGVAAQAKVIWHNIALVLAEADMSADDIVSITTYVVAAAAQDGLADAMAERDTFMSGRLVASTLLTVPALLRPEWLIEIVVVAAA